MKINTLLKNANQVLFTDNKHSDKNITGVKSLSDIKELFNIVGELKRTDFYFNCVVYKLVGSTYYFVIKIS